MDNDTNRNANQNNASLQHQPNLPQHKRQYDLSDTAKTAIVIGIAVCVALIVFIFVALQSLPGQALYGFKTNVVETFVESTRFGSESKASYQVTKMHRRLNELKSLMEDNNSDTATLDLLYAQTQRHNETLTSLIQQESENFSMEDRLWVVNDFAVLAGAMEALSESDSKYAALGDQMEDIRRESVNLYEDTAETFILSTTAQNAIDFIKAGLAEVSEKLNTPDVSAEAIDDAENYIDRVGIAVKDKKYARAITAVAEAYRFIEIEHYTGKLSEADPTNNSASSTPQTSTSTPAIGTSTFTTPEITI